MNVLDADRKSDAPLSLSPPLCFLIAGPAGAARPSLGQMAQQHGGGPSKNVMAGSGGMGGMGAPVASGGISVGALDFGLGMAGVGMGGGAGFGGAQQQQQRAPAPAPAAADYNPFL
jgi:hypothetical protein